MKVKLGNADGAKKKKKHNVSVPALDLSQLSFARGRTRVELIRNWVKSINSHLKRAKSQGRVDVGADIGLLDFPRMPTGIVTIDVLSAGGIPRGGATQIWGPFSGGKTTTAIHIARTQQDKGLTVCWAAAEPFSKRWARQNGVLIPYSERELEKLWEVDKDLAAFVEKDQEDWPVFGLIQHRHGDSLLELIYDAVVSNLWDMVVLDSIAAIQRTKQTEEASVEDQRRGGEASLYASFTKKMYSAYNVRYDPETLAPSLSDGTIENQTALLVLNQARQNMSYGGFQPVGGEALKHLWLLSLMFQKGDQLADTKKFRGKERRAVYGYKVRASCDKSKVCPPFRNGEYDFYFSAHKEGGRTLYPGQVDTMTELVAWGVYFELIKTNGAYYYYDDELLGQGEARAAVALMENEDVQQELYAKIIEESRRY